SARIDRRRITPGWSSRMLPNRSVSPWKSLRYHSLLTWSALPGQPTARRTQFRWHARYRFGTVEGGKLFPTPDDLCRCKSGRSQVRQLRRRRFREVVVTMVCQHIRNALGVEPRFEHERDPSILKRSLKGRIGRDRDVRIEEQPARHERREHLLDEALL